MPCWSSGGLSANAKFPRQDEAQALALAAQQVAMYTENWEDSMPAFFDEDRPEECANYMTERMSAGYELNAIDNRLLAKIQQETIGRLYMVDSISIQIRLQ